MNQEVEQEGATSSSRAGWGTRCRREDLTGYDDIEQFNDATSTEDASAASVSEYRRTAPPVKGACTSFVGSGAPCGACKFLRRKCANDCVFAPYFRADQHGAPRFAAVHKIFGASNVGKLLQSIPVQERDEAVRTISFEAQARIANPVHGCVAAIAVLQQQVQILQAELSFVHAQLANSRQLATVMALQQQQRGHSGSILPFEQSQPLDPIHMQQLLCHQISSPPTTASYNNRVKEEIENPLQGMTHLYDSLPVGTPPTPSLATDHMQPDMEHHHHHLSLDLIEKNNDIPSQSSTDATHPYALLRTRHLNLHDTP